MEGGVAEGELLEEDHSARTNPKALKLISPEFRFSGRNFSPFLEKKRLVHPIQFWPCLELCWGSALRYVENFNLKLFTLL